MYVQGCAADVGVLMDAVPGLDWPRAWPLNSTTNNASCCAAFMQFSSGLSRPSHVDRAFMKSFGSSGNLAEATPTSLLWFLQHRAILCSWDKHVT